MKHVQRSFDEQITHTCKSLFATLKFWHLNFYFAVSSHFQTRGSSTTIISQNDLKLDQLAHLIVACVSKLSVFEKICNCITSSQKCLLRSSNRSVIALFIICELMNFSNQSLIWKMWSDEWWRKFEAIWRRSTSRRFSQWENSIALD
jgi:hypothetical protein